VCDATRSRGPRAPSSSRNIKKKKQPPERDSFCGGGRSLERDAGRRERERNRFSERRSQGQFNYTRRVFGSQVLAFCNNHQHTHSAAFARRLGVEETRERDWERDKNLNGLELNAP
jgi:hypothetical protein